MKKYLTFSILIWGINVFSQINDFGKIPPFLKDNMEKLGEDSSSNLSELEIRYFNFIFKTYNFDFTNKNVGFIYGGKRSNKNEFFKLEYDRYKKKSTPNNSMLFILDNQLKDRCGNYDVVILYWNKKELSSNQICRILNQNK